jgi:hypothetical protein
MLQLTSAELIRLQPISSHTQVGICLLEVLVLVVCSLGNGERFLNQKLFASWDR